MKADAIIRWALIIIASIGFLDSLYLSWVKITHREALCGGSGDCQTVANSPYSEIAGVPIALLGLGAFLAIIGIVLLESRGGFWREYSPLIIFGITLAGVLYSIYLTYLEVAVIHAICPYCVVSAIAMLLLFILSITRLFIEGRDSTITQTRGG
jgi:uncharacterized membrane protein